MNWHPHRTNAHCHTLQGLRAPGQRGWEDGSKTKEEEEKKQMKKRPGTRCLLYLRIGKCRTTVQILCTQGDVWVREAAAETYHEPHRGLT